jgi:hypothetical protein
MIYFWFTGIGFYGVIVAAQLEHSAWRKCLSTPQMGSI